MASKWCSISSIRSALFRSDWLTNGTGLSLALIIHHDLCERAIYLVDVEGEQKFSNFSSSVVRFQPLNHHKLFSWRFVLVGLVVKRVWFPISICVRPPAINLISSNNRFPLKPGKIKDLQQMVVAVYKHQGFKSRVTDQNQPDGVPELRGPHPSVRLTGRGATPGQRCCHSGSNSPWPPNGRKRD